MATLNTRAALGRPLTHEELDDNFTYLNTVKLEVGEVGTKSQGASLGDLPAGLTGRVAATDTVVEALVKLEYQAAHPSGGGNSTTTGGVPIGAVIGLPKETADLVTLNGGKYLRSGVAVKSSLFPLAPPSADILDITVPVIGISGTWYTTAISDTGVIAAIKNSSVNAATSVNGGKTWTARSVPNLNTQEMAWGNGMFVAMIVNSANVLTSPDGITWTQRAAWSGAQVGYSIVFGGGQFVGITTNSANYITSPDGITWTRRTMPVSLSWMRVRYGNGLYVVVARGTDKYYTSPDAITWTEQTWSAGAQPWYDVCYGNGLWIVTIDLTSDTTSPNIYMTSPDGINWTQRVFPWARNSCPFVVAGNGGFVSMSRVAATPSMYSQDGINWLTTTAVTGIFWAGLFTGTHFLGFTNSTVVARFLGPGPFVDNLVATFVDSTTQNRPLYMRVD